MLTPPKACRVSWTPGVLLLVSVLSAAGCGGCGELSLQTPDGRTRTYRLHVPESAPARAPLVLALHGGGGNAESTQNTLGLDAIADVEGFVVAYPNGTGKKILGKAFFTWNSDEQCCGDAVDDNIDDVGFLKQLISQLEDDVGIDPDRVYVTGLSNGGNMSHRMACEAADVVAAVAPMGSPQVIASCAPSRPVPVMIVHGTDDQCAPFEDADTCGGCFAQALEESGIGEADTEDTFTNCEGAASQAALWRGHNGCGETSVRTLERGDVACDTFADGCAGADVTLCTVTGGGHTVPGSEYGCNPDRDFCQTFMRTVGRISDDMSLRDVWDFFEAHPR
jgi:polyhydroxybutyrate depolymerase